MARQVIVRFRLVGQSYKKVKVDGEEREVYVAEKDVRRQFGERPIFIDGKAKEKYPKMFSAGWAQSDKATDGSDGASELVVISYGNTIESANKSMIRALTRVDWENEARNI